MTSRILIADDDRELAELLADYLRHEAYEVEVVHDGAAAIERLNQPQQRPDLLILDVMMPGRTGLETLRELRARHALPVIMLSARGEPVDRVIGLELGADDYLAKPCLPRELLARVRARLRAPSSAAGEALEAGHLRIEPLIRRATIDGTPLELTGAEFALLLALASRLGQVVDKAVLTREGLGREIERFDRSVDVHISRLRKKLADASTLAPRIESIRGAGYQLIATAAATASSP
ncbi:response regulator transcription factor [Nevskia sp.]|uniref:response regulator transcription factor n=1 Tax=Nevskia sp. TaxID=1929292 RepID=UPI0025DB1E23|nr:response regulator transcription factor [Nevskia sp.]HET7798108.1 response regulator transcription factor [Nevskia sp.]